MLLIIFSIRKLSNQIITASKWVYEFFENKMHMHVAKVNNT